MTAYYKWMLPDMRTPVQRTPWPVAVGEWTKPETPVLCESGWHAMEEKDVLNHLPSEYGAQLWRVEVRGQMAHGGDKFSAESMRLLYCLGETTEQNLRLFACDVAEDVLPIFEAKYPNDNRPRRSIEVTRLFCEGKATREEMYKSAWVARAAGAAGAARAAAKEKYSNWLVVRIESGY